MFIIYGISGCSYCRRAKELLSSHNLEFEYTEIHRNLKKEFLDSKREQINNHNTFPVIFDNDKFIGGFRELTLYLLKNEI